MSGYVTTSLNRSLSSRSPYASFPYGEEGDKWVPLKVRPTRVPAQFAICAVFNPTAAKGVYANYDSEAGKHWRARRPKHPIYSRELAD